MVFRGLIRVRCLDWVLGAPGFNPKWSSNGLGRPPEKPGGRGGGIMAAPQLLMPKATAVWLVENTTLTFEQIGAFCNLHPLEVQGIADGEVAIGIVGLDPTGNGQLSKEEILRCEQDGNERLKMAKVAIPL